MYAAECQQRQEKTKLQQKKNICNAKYCGVILFFFSVSAAAVFRMNILCLSCFLTCFEVEKGRATEREREREEVEKKKQNK